MLSEIKDKINLETIVNDLKEENEFTINIPGFYSSDIIEIFKKYDSRYSRIGFKKWSVSPEHKPIREFNEPVESVDKIIIVIRFIALSLAAFLLFDLIFKKFFYPFFYPYWFKIETPFQNLPIAGNLVADAAMSIITIIVIKAKFETLLRKYLGV